MQEPSLVSVKRNKEAFVMNEIKRNNGTFVGKDADFLVFDNDLLTAEHEGFSQNKPKDVYFAGKKVN